MTGIERLREFGGAVSRDVRLYDVTSRDYDEREGLSAEHDGGLLGEIVEDIADQIERETQPKSDPAADVSMSAYDLLPPDERGAIAWVRERGGLDAVKARWDGYVKNELYSRFIEDGSFLRLKSVTLGYTLPQQWTRKFYVSKLRIYFSGQNLFVVTGYSGYDPEVNMRASNPMTPSFDWGAYPRSKVYTVGLDVTF